MNEKSLLHLCAEAAFALGDVYLEKPLSVGDVRIFTNGRLNLWKLWEDLAAEDCQLVARFLNLRHDSLADDRVLLRAATEVFRDGSRFSCDDTENVGIQTAFAACHGRPGREMAEIVLSELQDRRKVSEVAGLKSTSPGDHEIAFDNGRDVSFSLPKADTKVDAEAFPELETTTANAVQLDVARLLSLADRLDRAGSDPGLNYRLVLEERLLRTLRTSTDEPLTSLTIPAGATQLLVAPTGRGKSVLTRVAALAWAELGVPVAIVVPDVKDTLIATYRLESCAKSLGLDLNIVAINSTRQQFTKTVELLDTSLPFDTSGNWTLNRLGYFCRLEAHAASGQVAAGNEPCHHLRQTIDGRTHSAFCPFVATCPKFAAFQAAPTADILVVNHAAYLMGRVPVPIRVGAEIVPKMSILELAMRRAGITLIDEVDLLQKRAIDQRAGALQLSSQARVSPLARFSDELMTRRATGQLPSTERLNRAGMPSRRAIDLAEELAERINRGEIEWSEQRILRWSGSHDSKLAQLLFPDANEPLARLDTVFNSDDPPGIEPDRSIHRELSRWRSSLSEGQAETDELLEALNRVLLGHLTGKRRDRIKTAVSDIIIRAILDRLETAINRLRPELARFSEHGMNSAMQIRDSLLGFVPWSPSPLGPLGRRIIGFTFKREGEEPGHLEAQALSGDPHALIRGLGDEVSLSLASVRRPVLGLSATAWFPGAPLCDVRSPLLLYQADEDRNIEIEPLDLNDPDRAGEQIRISGQSNSSRRLTEARKMGSVLWVQVLRAHLQSLEYRDDFPKPDRVLLVTSSSAETKAVAAGLMQTIADEGLGSELVRFVVRDHDDTSNPAAIRRREIEDFSSTDARVLIAPLSIISRGYNILRPGTQHSAIASIFLLVRPVIPIEANLALAHISYDAHTRPHAAERPSVAVENERRRAIARLGILKRNAVPQSRMNPDIRRQILCDVLVEVAQLLGRARRGERRTPVRAYFVDAAFFDHRVGWANLIQQALKIWEVNDQLDRMRIIHGGVITALEDFAGKCQKGTDAEEHRPDNVV